MMSPEILVACFMQNDLWYRCNRMKLLPQSCESFSFVVILFPITDTGRPFHRKLSAMVDLI